MSFNGGSELLDELRLEVEGFIRSHAHPVVIEDGLELFDLSVTQWRTSVAFGKLIFEAWNSTRTITRRIEALAYRDAARLGIFVRKPGAQGTATLELRESSQATAGRARTFSRAEFSRRLVAMLGRQYPGWRLEHVSHRSDREFSFSTWYTRGLARQGRNAWAFLGLDENEPQAAADSIVAFGLIWLDWLRNRTARGAVSGLKLFMPREATERNVSRIRRLNPRALKVELFEWEGGGSTLNPVNIGSHGEPDARLVMRRQGEALLERHNRMLRGMLGETYDQVTIVPDWSGGNLSIRVAGLELARVEGDLAPRILFGLEGSVREYRRNRSQEFLQFVRSAIARRSIRNSDHQDKFYRLQAERWLESILIKDLSKIDPELSRHFAYSQVPSFAGEERGVIDVLGTTLDGRLAVIELKLEEHVNLPFQALDYWIRVANLAQRGKFQEYGYFPDVRLQSLPPRLYLVAPAFRFHSTTDALLRYLEPSIDVVRVGINQDWRAGVQVLFRRARPKPM